MSHQLPYRCWPIRMLGSQLIAAAFTFLSSPAMAAIDAIEMPLDELVKISIVSTPKFAENPDQIPSIVSILNAEDIRQYGWRTLGDALRTLQGFNVTDDHTYGYAGVRGISQPGDYRPRLQVLIDGVSVNENLYSSAPADSAFPLDIGLIERIEVIRGPSASIYGGDAMFGVINIVTRSGQSVGGEASLSLGSGANRRLRASWGGRVGDKDVLISATGFDANGRTLNFNDVNGDGSSRELHHIGGEDGKQLFAKVSGDNWRFSLIHAERNRIVPTASYDTIANDRGHIESDRYTLLNLSKDWKLNSTNTLQQQFYFGDYRYDGEFPYDYSPADSRLMNIDKARGTWWGIDNRLVNTTYSGHRWTLGVEYKENSRQDQLNYDRNYGCYDTASVTPCLDDRQKSHQLTVLAQDEIQLGTSSLLTVGLSHTRAGSLGSFWSPRLGLVHDTGPAGLFKVLYGTAFRIPTVYERAYSTSAFLYGNLNLRPEKMRSLELSWEKRFSRQNRVSATVYHFQIEKMVTIDGAGTAMNGTPARATGFEIEYEQRWSNGARLRTGYSLQHAADDSSEFDNSPHHMVKLNAAVPTGISHLSAGLEGQWISGRRANLGADRVPAYLLANLNLTYEPPGQPWNIALGVYNLFDHRYNDPVAIDTILSITRWQIPQLGRSFQLKTNLRF